MDTGYGLGDVDRPERLPRFARWTIRPRLDAAETAVRQITRLGHAAEDVRHIVLTHLDYDHAGGLAEFPHAKVHVYAAELDAALRPATSKERLRYLPDQWAHGPDWVEHTTRGETWNGFSAVRDLPGLPPEVLLGPLAGHTRGHAGVAVNTGERWLLHAGDAYFSPLQMAERPSCPPATRAFQTMFQADRAARVHNLNRLNELARSGAVEVFSAHDSTEFDRARTE